jgi:hypothetical protein
MSAFSRIIAVFALAAAGGCTHWATTPVYGQRSEVGRRLLGSPQVEEVSSSNASAGFSTFGESYGNRHYSSGYQVGGLEGSTDSARRTHCVQQAEIDYVQPMQYDTHVAGRPLDVAGAIALGVLGMAVIGIAHAQYGNAESFYEMDPSFFAKPSQPTLAYGAGGAAMIGAGIWLAYSMGSLPKGPAPVEQPTQRAWTETAYVEATGCGLVPADRSASLAPRRGDDDPLALRHDHTAGLLDRHREQRRVGDVQLRRDRHDDLARMIDALPH